MLNEEDLQDKGLNERQIKAVLYIKENSKITNLQYLENNKGITDRTALWDLDVLIEKGIFQRIGNKKAAYYVLANVG
jgi:ATP-dependent DNA helicase RecG